MEWIQPKSKVSKVSRSIVSAIHSKYPCETPYVEKSVGKRNANDLFSKSSFFNESQKIHHY